MIKDGLSLKQQEAAELLATSHSSDAVIAEKLGITVGTLKFWKNDLRFKVLVFQLFEQRLEYERNVRIKRIARYLKPVYKAISQKLKDDRIVRTLSLKDLLKIMGQLHYEIRQDKIVFKKSSTEDSMQESNTEVTGRQEPEEIVDLDGIAMAKRMYLSERRAASGKVVPIQRSKE